MLLGMPRMKMLRDAEKEWDGGSSLRGLTLFGVSWWDVALSFTWRLGFVSLAVLVLLHPSFPALWAESRG